MLRCLQIEACKYIRFVTKLFKLIMNLKLYLTMTILLVVLASRGAIISSNLYAVKDATLYFSSDGSVAGGGDDRLFVGRNGINGLLRSLIQFDFSSIPTGAVVQAASLQLTTVHTLRDGSSGVSAYRVTQAWSEGSTMPQRGGGEGNPAVTGDVTWLYSNYSNTLWSQAGGDFSSTLSSSVAVNFEGTHTLSGLAEDVQSMVDSPDQNFGWVLLRTSESSHAIKFGSRTHATGQPVLQVTYESVIPEPQVVGLILISSTLLASNRRKIREKASLKFYEVGVDAPFTKKK